ncbi:general secretion pathway protein GspK [bacterium]|nr:general secretion pathway protein GspK [bacterium]
MKRRQRSLSHKVRTLGAGAESSGSWIAGLRREIGGLLQSMWRTSANDRRGIALLMTIWIMILLTVMALEFSFAKRVDLTVAVNFRDEMQAYYYAMAGVNMAMAELLSKQHYFGSGGGLYFVARQVKWDDAGDVELDEASPNRTDVQLGRGSFTYELVDERRKLDIRLSSNDDRFLDLLVNSGVDEMTADTILDSLKDWRDADDTRRLNGAEDEYYQANYEEHGMPEPYLAKNDQLDSVRELLLINGVTPEILFGSGNIENYGYREESGTDDDGDTYSGVYDLLTIWGSSLYYDTASDELLDGLTNDTRAQDELDRREDEDWNYQTASTHPITSSKFTITSTGRVRNTEVARTVVAVVRKVGTVRNPRVEILEWHDNYVGSAYMQFGGEF